MLEPEPSAKWAGCRSAREKERQARNAAETERDRASAAEKVAKNDRAVAEATVKFLHDDLLAQADPLLEPDRDLKLRTLLDRAAAAIAGRYDAAPLVEASIRQLIGDIYECLGEYDLTRVHLERAREIYQQQLDFNDAQLAGQYKQSGSAGNEPRALLTF